MVLYGLSFRIPQSEVRISMFHVEHKRVLPALLNKSAFIRVIQPFQI